MSLKFEIEHRLRDAFPTAEYDIVNESHLHQGHAGDDGSGDSHYNITIRAHEFSDMTRLARHRAVQKALGDLNTRIHAIALELIPIPQEK